jgi:hypothetical protein
MAMGEGAMVNGQWLMVNQGIDRKSAQIDMWNSEQVNS